MRKATADWLESARMDLESIAQIVHLEHLTPVAAFHAQQCVEKFPVNWACFLTGVPALRMRRNSMRLPRTSIDG